jgi:hypothetical protein
MLRPYALCSRFCSAVLACILLIGCATAPIQETKAFSDAALSVKSAGDLLFDSLAAAERRSYKANAKLDKRRAYVFDIGDAPYFATIGEPPDVTAFRHSLDLVKNYAALLVSLAEGKDVEQNRGQILAIVNDIATIAKFSQLAPAAGALTTILDQALHAYSAAEARRIAIEGAPFVQQIIRLLKEATPSMFKALAGDLISTRGSADALEATRVTISNFVMLLDSLNLVLDRMVDAYQQPSSPTSLAALLQMTANLNADVLAARKAFAEMRTK